MLNWWKDHGDICVQNNAWSVRKVSQIGQDGMMASRRRCKGGSSDNGVVISRSSDHQQRFSHHRWGGGLSWWDLPGVDRPRYSSPKRAGGNRLRGGTITELLDKQLAQIFMLPGALKAESANLLGSWRVSLDHGSSARRLVREGWLRHVDYCDAFKARAE